MNTSETITVLQRQLERCIQEEQRSERISRRNVGSDGTVTAWHLANARKWRSKITRLGYAIQFLELRLEGRKPRWFGRQR